jgi:HK97 gp10 family phage protein
MSEWNLNELTALDRMLGGASERVMKAVGVEVKAGGEAVRDRAKDLAPKRTGKLRRSIKSTVTRARDTETSTEVGPTVPYGTFVEHGTSKRAAHPFLGPAADQLAGGIAEKIADAAAGSVLE